MTTSTDNKGKQFINKNYSLPAFCITRFAHYFTFIFYQIMLCLTDNSIYNNHNNFNNNNKNDDNNSEKKNNNHNNNDNDNNNHNHNINIKNNTNNEFQHSSLL